MQATTLAVLSDLHVDLKDHPASWDLAKRAFALAAKTKADHVVICGDIFDGASVMVRDREKVSQALRKLGLWHRDRLSIVIGNHDVFHLAGRSSEWGKVRRVLKALGRRAQRHYEMFCHWIDDLLDADDLLAKGDRFPFRKDLGDVTLVGADTTSYSTWTSTIGYWRKADDAAVRRGLADACQRRVLAIHHPPDEGEEENLITQARRVRADQKISFGFPSADFKSLVRLADGVGLDAILCGHIHTNGGDPWNWRVGKSTRAYMMGRTGGMDGAIPSFGVLTIPRKGALRWRTIRVTK